MLASFSALNEVTNSEISESSTDVSEEIPEFDVSFKFSLPNL